MKQYDVEMEIIENISIMTFANNDVEAQEKAIKYCKDHGLTLAENSNITVDEARKDENK